MIWWLVNAWWLVALAIAIPAVVALVAGFGPMLPGIARRVPVAVWAALVAVLAVSLASGWLVGVGEERCRAAQEAAEVKADVKAAGAHRKAADAAKRETATITKETADAVAQVRTIVRTVPSGCPPMPAELRDTLQRQVEAAR